MKRLYSFVGCLLLFISCSSPRERCKDTLERKDFLDYCVIFAGSAANVTSDPATVRVRDFTLLLCANQIREQQACSGRSSFPSLDLYQ